jgi:hypothetical protein
MNATITKRPDGLWVLRVDGEQIESPAFFFYLLWIVRHVYGLTETNVTIIGSM